jgi:hypothetical protein
MILQSRSLKSAPPRILNRSKRSDCSSERSHFSIVAHAPLTSLILGARSEASLITKVTFTIETARDTPPSLLKLVLRSEHPHMTTRQASAVLAFRELP